MYPYRILIVDDEKSQREMLSGYLRKKGLRPTDAPSGEEALSIIEKYGFEIALLDLRLPGIGGIELLKRLRENLPDISVIMITAHGDVHSAVEAMKSGALDYLNKPIDLEELMTIIKKAGERFKILSENRRLKEVIQSNSSATEFIGESEPIRKLLSTVYRVAKTDSTVLITGESGTGKELIAGLIHKASNCKSGPFIPVACGALPENLLESELFGHEKGAFTGANRLRLGRFELADGGTIFLDEIGEVPLSVQAKLLRVLEENRIMRVGGDYYVEVNARIVAATNRNLVEEVERDNFRGDLFYRLNVIELHIPALRERKEDIGILIDYFIKKFNQRHKKDVQGISSEAKDKLMRYSWPGNVRELENVLERAIILTQSSVIDTEDLPDNFRTKSNPPVSLSGIKTLKEGEKLLIKRALEENGWNIIAAAGQLGIHRNTLTAKIKEYGLRKTDG